MVRMEGFEPSSTGF